MIAAIPLNGPLPATSTPDGLRLDTILMLLCGGLLLVEGCVLFLRSRHMRSLTRHKLTIICLLLGIGTLLIATHVWVAYTSLSASEPTYNGLLNDQFGLWTIQIDQANELYGTACFLLVLATAILLIVGAARIYRRRREFIAGGANLSQAARIYRRRREFIAGVADISQAFPERRDRQQQRYCCVCASYCRA